MIAVDRATRPTQRAHAIGSRSRVRVGVSFVVAVGPAIALSCTIIGSFIGFAVGSTSKWVAALLALVTGAAVIAPAARRGAVRIARPSAAELAVLALWLLAVLWICHNTLRWSWFAPVTYSVDAAHHTGKAALLAQDWRMSVGVQLTRYPLGPHAAAVVLSTVTGLAVVTSVWWTAIGSVFNSLLLVMVAAKTADVRRSWIGAPVALAVALAAWRYTVGVVTWDYFVGLAAGMHLLLAVVALATWGMGSSVPLRAWLPASGLIALAIVTSYPQLAPIAPIVIVVCLVARLAQDRRRTPEVRRRLLRITAAIAAASAAVAVVSLSATGGLDEIRRSLTVIDEGYAAHATIANAGGLVVALAVLLGLVVVGSSAVRLRGNAVPVLAAVLALLAIIAVLSVFRSTAGTISDYRIRKLWYAAAPLAAIVAGLAVGPIARAARSHLGARALSASTIAIALVVALRPFPMSPTSVPYVGSDEWRLAEWAARRHAATDIGLAGPGFSPYALWWGAVMRPVYGPDMIEDQRIAYWSDWPGGKHKERFLLVVGQRLIDDYLERPGVTLVRQSGRAALLQRTAAAATATESDAASGRAEQGAPGL